MPFDIIHDAEKGIAALIDPQVGRALGPVALGEDAVKILDSFAGIHGVDPATLPVHTIESRWEQFVKDITDIKDIVEEGADVLEGKPAVAPPVSVDPTDTTGEQAPPSQAQIDSATHAETVAPSAPPAAAPADTDQPAALTAPAVPAVPSADQRICPECDGFRTVVAGGVEKPCPTCSGAGVVPDAGFPPSPPAVS